MTSDDIKNLEFKVTANTIIKVSDILCDLDIRDELDYPDSDIIQHIIDYIREDLAEDSSFINIEVVSHDISN